MSRSLQLFIPGEPKAQPRPKARRAGKHISIYTPATAKAWKEAVMAGYKGLKVGRQVHWSKEKPLQVSLEFWMPRPKIHFLKSGLRENAPVWHQTRPDCDNLAKAVLDALQDAQVFHEDSQVVKLTVVKRYHEEDQVPGCLICAFDA